MCFFVSWLAEFDTFHGGGITLAGRGCDSVRAATASFRTSTQQGSVAQQHIVWCASVFACGTLMRVRCDIRSSQCELIRSTANNCATTSHSRGASLVLVWFFRRIRAVHDAAHKKKLCVRKAPSGNLFSASLTSSGSIETR